MSSVLRPVTEPVLLSAGSAVSAEPAGRPRPRARDLRVLPGPFGPGWHGLAIMGTALGVLGQAWYGYQGRADGSGSAVEFYVSLCLVFVPSALMVVSRRATKTVRIGFLLYMSLALVATRFMLYPTMFASHDEIVHEWNVIAIDTTHHLFTANAILPVTPYYPGLEIATSAIEHLTGLTLHQSATVLMLLLRVVMTLGLIQVFHRITGNTAIATLAALAYVVNPQYIFFNSEFSYQTVALPLCFFCVYVFAIRKRSLGVRGILPAVAVAAAIAGSHHLTSVALVAIVWTWYFYTRLKREPEPHLVHFAALVTIAVALWTWVASREVIPYIGDIAVKNVHGIINLLAGNAGHTLFQDSAGDREPLWEISLSLASVLLICVIWLLIVWYVLRRHRSLSAASLTMATAAVLYPIVPAGHLAAATGEVADRAAGFAYVGLGLIFAWWWHSARTNRRPGAVGESLPDARPRYRAVRRYRIPRAGWVLPAALTVCFAGGIVDGAGPNWQYGPGSYLVSADNRSIDPMALEAAYWESWHLPAGSRVLTDRDNALLAQTYGGAFPLTDASTGIPAGKLSPLLLAPPSEKDVPTACAANVQYLIADTRITTGMPHVGLYIDSGEYEEVVRTTPPPASALGKFADAPGVQLVFDNGAIKIYDFKGLPCQH